MDHEAENYIDELKAEIERLTGLLQNSEMTVRELLGNDERLRAALLPLSSNAKNYEAFTNERIVTIPVTVGELRRAIDLDATEQTAIRKCTACGDMKIDDLVEGITDENRHPETKW